MALLRYFKLAGGLPHPKCSLSSAIDPEFIAEMNKEVEEASHSEAKQGPYSTYTSSECLQIGMYASMHGTKAASRLFSSKLKKYVSLSTAKSMK